MYDLIILGGGPAGTAAGVYAARKKIKTLLIAENFGGQAVIAAEIKNFIGFKSISGMEMAKRLEEHLRDQEGIEIKNGRKAVSIIKRDNLFIVKTAQDETFSAKTLLLALGSSPKKLKVEGETKFEGKGVFYCSTCDAPLMKNKTAAVIGGGNSGFYAVMDLLPCSSKIYVLEYGNSFRADPVYIDKAKQSGKVEFITMAAVKEIFGDNFVKGLKYQARNSGEIKELNLDGVFVSIGYQANSGLVKDLAEINQNGKVVVDCKTQKTTCEGLWAAGDISDVLYNQINIAIGDAVKAVLNINDYLKKQE
jgi:alkyl hydroperoxide reductase subunit F